MSYVRLPDLELRPLHTIHPDLVQDHEDWEVMRELRARGGVDGWITIDRKMLSLEKEMVVLHQTRLSQVVFEDVGNDPIAATGLLMIHSKTIARQFDSRSPQLWVLRRPGTKPPMRPWDRIAEIARRQGATPEELFERHRLPYSQL
jgi:hypothetical protein